MKIFKFDPTTGKKGEFIRVSKLVTFCSMGLDFAVSKGFVQPIAYEKPYETSSTKWTAHLDAGTGLGKDQDSLLCDEWICFCMGSFRVNPQEEGTWEWVILPPRDLIVPIDE